MLFIENLELDALSALVSSRVVNVVWRFEVSDPLDDKSLNLETGAMLYSWEDLTFPIPLARVSVGVEL